MKIKKLDKADVSDIYEIEKSCFAKPWEKSVIEGTVAQKNYIYFGAYDGDTLIGYGSAAVIHKECYVNRIAVISSSRKQGAGSAVVSAIVDYCKAECDEFVSLEVRKSNAAAIALYQKHGFEKVGERRDFYENPTENALIMTLRLTNADSY